MKSNFPDNTEVHFLERTMSLTLGTAVDAPSKPPVFANFGSGRTHPLIDMVFEQYANEG
jgi:hypothetical protein